jgi:hypothetical protein
VSGVVSEANEGVSGVSGVVSEANEGVSDAERMEHVCRLLMGVWEQFSAIDVSLFNMLPAFFLNVKRVKTVHSLPAAVSSSFSSLHVILMLLL